MKDYTIYTYCSKNFKDAYDCTIDSWLATAAKQIIIYTDGKGWDSPNSRVQIVPLFRENDDWLVSVGRRTWAGRDIVSRGIKRLVFIDADCYLVREIGDLFDQEFDIAVTRLERSDITISAGIYFFRSSRRIKDFFDRWVRRQVKFWEKGVGKVTRKTSYSQRSFDKMIRGDYEKGSLHILPLKDVDYNWKVSAANVYELYWDLRVYRSKILHLFNELFRNKKAMYRFFQEIRDWREDEQNNLHNDDCE